MTTSYALVSFAEYDRPRRPILWSMLGALLLVGVAILFRSNGLLLVIATALSWCVIFASAFVLRRRIVAVVAWAFMHRAEQRKVTELLKQSRYNEAGAAIEALLETSSGREALFVRTMLFQQLAVCDLATGNLTRARQLVDAIFDAGVLESSTLRRRPRVRAAYVGSLAWSYFMLGERARAESLVRALPSSELDFRSAVLDAFAAYQDGRPEAESLLRAAHDAMPKDVGSITRCALVIALLALAKARADLTAVEKWSAELDAFSPATRELLRAHFPKLIDSPALGAA